jgi:hypothetical protein
MLFVKLEREDNHRTHGKHGKKKGLGGRNNEALVYGIREQGSLMFDLSTFDLSVL